MLRQIIGISLLGLSAIASAPAAEPRQIKSPAKLAHDEGVLLISLRSQQIFAEKLRIWFLREGGSESVDSDVIELDRRQAFGGPSMIKSIPRFYALKPGRYTLIAHMVGCAGIPPPGINCTYASGAENLPLPTARYTGGAPGFTVEPGKLTDAGEYVLEYPKGATSGSAIRDHQQARIRWRVLPFRVVGGFAKMPSGPAPSVPASFLSKIRCDTIRAGFLKPEFLPFEC